MTYALIGCGRIAVNHIKAALNNKLNIVAVCDVLPEKMEELLAKYDLQNDDSIARYTDYKKLLAEHPDLQLASIATHVADDKTCVLHPASSTHRQLSEAELAAAGVSADLIRLSVGIEDITDILADLEQALDQV